MKLSISLTDADVAALDKYAEATGLRSRSAAVQAAIRNLDDHELEQAYAEAWDEWSASGEADAWGATVGDGLSDAPR